MPRNCSCDDRCGRHGGWWYAICTGSYLRHRCISVDSILRAVPDDMTGFATLVASFASGLQWATVGGGTVARDMSQLSACVALHSLSLTVASEVVRSSAFVAHGRWVIPSSIVASASTCSKPASCSRSTACDWRCSGWGWSASYTWYSWGGAVALGLSQQSSQVIRFCGMRRLKSHVLRDVQLDHKYSSVLLARNR